MNAAQQQLCQLLGTRWPLIQAPMAGVQDHALAVAVNQTGGLGSLPAAMLSPSGLLEELKALREAVPRTAETEQTKLPFNINFFCHTPPVPDEDRERRWRETLRHYAQPLGIDVHAAPTGAGRAPFSEALADLIEPFRPAVVSFHFGLPEAPLLQRVKSWGAVVLSSATTVDEAVWLQSRGADVVIAQGLEAGGHRGHFLSADLTCQMGTLSLLPQVVAAVRVPVVAAGGIADADGIAAALSLGAAGVQVGTSYLLCPEAKTSRVHRQALQSPSRQHTALTNLMTGRPARGIVNRLMRELGPINSVAPEFPLATAALAPLRAAAEALGTSDFTPLWAGQNASGCKPLAAAELTRQLCRAFEQAG